MANGTGMMYPPRTRSMGAPGKFYPPKTREAGVKAGQKGMEAKRLANKKGLPNGRAG